MNKRVLTILIMMTSFLFVNSSCDKDDDGNEKMQSNYNGDESHNTGQNCMNCHLQGGDGEGWFIIAGSVYDSLKTSSYPNSLINLYGGPNGTGGLVAAIEVDGLGNFYTTNEINFGNGLYTSASGNTSTEHMNMPITSGHCNSCHGGSVERIWTK